MPICKKCNNEYTIIERKDIPVSHLPDIETTENLLLSQGVLTANYCYCPVCSTYGIISVNENVNITAKTHGILRFYFRADEANGNLEEIISELEILYPPVKDLLKQVDENNDEITIEYPFHTAFLTNPFFMGRFACILHYFMLHSKKINFVPRHYFEINKN